MAASSRLRDDYECPSFPLAVGNGPTLDRLPSFSPKAFVQPLYVHGLDRLDPFCCGPDRKSDRVAPLGPRLFALYLADPCRPANPRHAAAPAGQLQPVF